jgi:NADP-dependent 3-hydroxy acid dehydrogenase YdfG
MLIGVKAIVPHFRQRGEATIVNISSVGGKVAFPLGSLYHGSKFAIEGSTEALQFRDGGNWRLREVWLSQAIHVRTSQDARFNLMTTRALPSTEKWSPKRWKLSSPSARDASDPKSVAETIYRAATDGTDQLWCVSGSDAEASCNHESVRTTRPSHAAFASCSVWSMPVTY